MKRWIAVCLVAAGCYRSSPPPAEPAPEPARPVDLGTQASYAHTRLRSAPQAPVERSVIADAIARLEEFAEDMCACRDQTCIDAVTQEMTRWSADLTREHQDLKPTDDEMREATRVSEKLSKCMVAAMSQVSPSPSPPTP